LTAPTARTRSNSRPYATVADIGTRIGIALPVEGADADTVLRRLKCMELQPSLRDANRELVGYWRDGSPGHLDQAFSKMKNMLARVWTKDRIDVVRSAVTKHPHGLPQEAPLTVDATARELSTAIDAVVGLLCP
jgi:hypothetical protein